MPDIEMKLREYVEKRLNDEGYRKKERRDWAFGAVDFAANVGLINTVTYSALLEEFGFI